MCSSEKNEKEEVEEIKCFLFFYCRIFMLQNGYFLLSYLLPFTVLMFFPFYIFYHFHKEDDNKEQERESERLHLCRLQSLKIYVW